MSYEIILIDADNTLFDFSKSEKKAFFETYADLCLECNEQKYAEYKKINELTWQIIEKSSTNNLPLLISRFEKVFAMFKDNADVVKANEIYRKRLGEGHEMLYGARKLLNLLKKDGKRTFLITNGIPKTQRKRLKDSRTNKFFEGIFISDEIGVRKPSTEFFEYCASKIEGFCKQKTLVVGDSLSSDILGGYLFGADTCWYNPKNAENTLGIPITYEVKNHSQIYRIISPK